MYFVRNIPILQCIKLHEMCTLFVTSQFCSCFKRQDMYFVRNIPILQCIKQHDMYPIHNLAIQFLFVVYLGQLWWLIGLALSDYGINRYKAAIVYEMKSVEISATEVQNPTILSNFMTWKSRFLHL